MAEFCTCGSLMLEGSCTNKNCVNKTAGKSTTAKKTRAKKDTLETKPKTTRTRKASKCITYNLYETKEENSI
ncbi:MAG: hypothetical protein GX270_15760 [Clostridiaceae bacterium]|nr:hypothetical protein [Clostridiaceae bacterium]